MHSSIAWVEWVLGPDERVRILDQHALLTPYAHDEAPPSISIRLGQGRVNATAACKTSGIGKPNIVAGL